MNILPHKSWHVRTKANIAKVRKDQAKAADEEAEKHRKISLAESEARIDSLRQKKGIVATTTSQDVSEPLQNNAFPADQHIDLFADFKEKITTAKPMDEEKRREQEKYEKQIGYLTYLGQDTHEALGTRSWYDQAPNRKGNDDEHVEIGFKAKQRHDPMRLFAQHRDHTVPSIKSKSPTKASTTTPESELISKKNNLKYIPLMPPSVRKHRDGSHDDDDSPKRKRKNKDRDGHDKSNKKKKKKKRKKDSRERSRSRKEHTDDNLQKQSAESLELLREKRLRREAEEKLRAYELLHGKASTSVQEPATTAATTAAPIPHVKQKYNSQFNPVLAKQNYN